MSKSRLREQRSDTSRRQQLKITVHNSNTETETEREAYRKSAQWSAHRDAAPFCNTQNRPSRNDNAQSKRTAQTIAAKTQQQQLQHTKTQSSYLRVSAKNETDSARQARYEQLQNNIKELSQSDQLNYVDREEQAHKAHKNYETSQHSDSR